VKPIKTLDDLAAASEEDIQEAAASVSIMGALEEYLEWLSDSETTTIVTAELRRHKRRSLGIHPSAACKPKACLLKLYYGCTGEILPQRAYEEENQRIWDIGTLLHETYQAHFNSMFGDQFQDEVKLVDEALHIKSRTDGLFHFSLVKAILEMKSIKEGGKFGWSTVQNKPEAGNVRQCHFYMKVADAPFANLFYMNKNTGQLKEYVLTFDFDLWDELQTEVVEPVIAAAYEDGPAVEGRPSWDCRWCDYNYACPAVKQERKHVKGANRPWAKR